MVNENQPRLCWGLLAITPKHSRHLFCAAFHPCDDPDDEANHLLALSR